MIPSTEKGTSWRQGPNRGGVVYKPMEFTRTVTSPQLQLKRATQDDMAFLSLVECPVCYQGFKLEEDVAATHCRHTYHAVCVVE